MGLADDDRLVRTAVEGVFDQPLEGGVLLLDDDNLVQAPGKCPDNRRVERHGHLHLEYTDAGGGDLCRGRQPQSAKGLERFVVGEAAGDEPYPRIRRVDRGPVQAVGQRVAPDEFGAGLSEVLLQSQGVWGDEVAVGAVFVGHTVDDHVGNHGDRASQVEICGAAAVTYGGDDLQGGPHSGESGQFDGVAAQVQDLLDVTRVEDRYVEVDQCRIRTGRQRGALGGGIVPDQDDGTSVAGRSSEHGMSEGVSGPVQAGCLAVPDAQNPVVLAVGLFGGQLGAHYGRGCEFFVQARLVNDRKIGNDGSGPGDLLIKASQRRSRVPGDERGGVEPSQPVDAQLLDCDPCEGLDASEEGGALVLQVPVSQPVVVEECHGSPPSFGTTTVVTVMAALFNV